MGKGGEITYQQSGAEGLDAIEKLWLKLRRHHKERSPYFKEHFDEFKWKDRKKDLFNRAENGDLLVQTASDNGKMVGYCVSSVNDKHVGEIESIFIEVEYRKHRIGDHFMKAALAWMDGQDVKRKVIGVAVGNEEAFGFYRKYGFYPRLTTLMQKP